MLKGKGRASSSDDCHPDASQHYRYHPQQPSSSWASWLFDHNGDLNGVTFSEPAIKQMPLGSPETLKGDVQSSARKSFDSEGSLQLRSPNPTAGPMETGNGESSSSSISADHENIHADIDEGTLMWEAQVSQLILNARLRRLAHLPS